MIWLDYVRQDGEAYADLKKFLSDLRVRTLESMLYAKDMEQVAKIKGAVDCIVALQVSVTAEERDQHERAEREATRQRESRGEARIGL